MTFLSIILAITVVCIIIGLVLATFVAFTFALDEEPRWWRWPLTVISLVTTLLIIATGIWYLSANETPGVHEWRGGSGPSTTCVYEVRDELVSNGDGKTSHMEQRTYTVCRDAR